MSLQVVTHGKDYKEHSQVKGGVRENALSGEHAGSS